MTTESRWSGPIASSDGRLVLQYETPDWQTTYRFEDVNGYPAIASICIEPRGDGAVPPELSATLTRELLLPGQAVEIVRKFMRDPLTRASASVLPMVREMLDRYHDSRPRRGKRQPDSFYASIASCYAHEIAAGNRKAVDGTAERLGEDPDFVRYALDRARKRELLTRPTSRGKAGGELTQLGREVLQAGPTH